MDRGLGEPATRPEGDAVSEATFAVLMLLILAWAFTSQLLARMNITGPLVFAVAGYVLANPDWGSLSVGVDTPSIHLLAELTLALLLFSDATRVNVSRLKRDLAFPGRLLAVGLPLSVVLGSLLAAWFFQDFSWALAGFVGATLAPTDAALSAQVIDDARIPTRIRRALNVESGLNDGIVTPIVIVMLAIAASQLGHVSESASAHAGGALRDLCVGLAVGVVAGAGGAALMNIAARHHWADKGGRRMAALAVALTAFSVALAIDANGFIAAFAAGVAFGATLIKDVVDLERTDELPDLGSQLLALVVWFLFGATLLPIAFA